MSTITHVRAGRGGGIDPNGWRRIPREPERTMKTLTQVRAAQGSGIDPNGWRGPAPGGHAMNTMTHLRAGEGAGICPNGNSGPGGGGSSGGGSSGPGGWEFSNPGETMSTTTRIRAGEGTGIDPHGDGTWREDADDHANHGPLRRRQPAGPQRAPLRGCSWTRPQVGNVVFLRERPHAMWWCTMPWARPKDLLRSTRRQWSRTEASPTFRGQDPSVDGSCPGKDLRGGSLRKTRQGGPRFSNTCWSVRTPWPRILTMNTTTTVRAGNGSQLDPSGGQRGAMIDPNGWGSHDHADPAPCR